MEENVKNICYDRDLKLEAYSFNGIVQPFPNHIHDYYVAGIVEKACRFMKTEYGRQITLDELCTVSMLGKSTLLRYFTKTKGITPYRYLQSVRIDKAKNMLEQGKSTAETALAAGFSDQSHFTRYFNHFIGVSPYQYKRIFESKRGNTNEDLKFMGLAICGNKKKINKLTGSMPLLR